MHKTKHIEKRMGQRGISKAMIELVLNYGKTRGARSFSIAGQPRS